MYTLEQIGIMEKAQKWAVEGHMGVNRKHSDLPYIVHPEAVAQIVMEITDDYEVISAAWLHDYVEDVEGATYGKIARAFTIHVGELVYEVSKISRLSDGDRRIRVALDREHYSYGSKWGKAIKIADMIHNMPTMIRDSPEFAKTYIPEKESLLEVIKDGSPLLASIAMQIIEDYKKSLTPIDLYSKIKEIKR